MIMEAPGRPSVDGGPGEGRVKGGKGAAFELMSGGKNRSDSTKENSGNSGIVAPEKDPLAAQ